MDAAPTTISRVLDVNMVEAVMTELREAGARVQIMEDVLAREAAKEDARQVAASERYSMLMSNDPKMLALGAARITDLRDRARPLKAWQDYLRVAAPAPTHDLVMLTPATRWRDPSVLGREPLWEYPRVGKYHARGSGPEPGTFYLDADGNYRKHFGGGTWQPVGDKCIVTAGVAVRFNRYSRRPDPVFRTAKVWQVAVEGGTVYPSDKSPAPAALLVSAICELGGVVAPDNFGFWHVSL